ncbi:MAG: hypothetical protein ACM3X4_02135 [Ignavibacteriales bacterium]
MRKVPDPEYMNQVIASLEKAFYDERGRGGRYRTTLVGTGYFEPLLEAAHGRNWRETLDSVCDSLTRSNIADRMTVEYDGQNVLLVEVSGCVHGSFHSAEGVEPFVCPPGNAVMRVFSKAFGVHPELMSITCTGTGCRMSLVVPGAKLD